MAHSRVFPTCCCSSFPVAAAACYEASCPSVAAYLPRRLSQQGALSALPPPAHAGLGAGPAGAAPGGGPVLTAGGHATAAGAGGGGGGGGALTAADVEARVALELRASRAEAELAALRQQVGEAAIGRPCGSLVALRVSLV